MMSQPSPDGPDLADVLTLERLDETTFRRRLRGAGAARRLFGGEAFALAVLAASRSIGDARLVTAAQAHFLLPGSTAQDLTLRARVVRDGGSFSVRHVDVEQSGSTILTMLASGQAPEPGLSHQLPQAEPAPPPESLPTPEELFHDDEQNLRWIRSLLGRNPVECRFVDRPPRAAGVRGVPAEPRQRTWIRARGGVLDDEATRRAAIAYLSDLFLLATSVAPHGRTIQDEDLQFATIDHSVWFHLSPPVGEWLLYDQRGTWAGGARALCQGAFYTRSGELVATVVQQALVRVRRSPDDR
ncbi:MAG: thioesterase family protein [Microbacterium sp.]